ESEELWQVMDVQQIRGIEFLVSRCLARGVGGATRTVLEARWVLFLVTAQPFAHHLPGGMPEVCGSADAFGLLIGL
ncbi:MAG: hypothetical protein ACUVR2_07940, partial [Anaerolineae bacterium]